MEVASKLLTKLDNGLRSSRPSDQLEQLLNFPQFFSSNPFPAIINTGFLKLADLYRTGSNDVRYQILNVLKQCVSHFTQILNTDEVLRRFSVILQSNDPIARAITLRVLGVMASVIEGRLEIQQNIRDALGVPHSLELDAAIFAVDRCSQVSKSFAASVFEAIVFKVGAIETPLHAKLKLIHLFRHMHHEPALATKASHFCRELLQSYPMSDFTLVIMDTLTNIAIHFTQEIPEQVELLLSTCERETRIAVQLGCLRNLATLAKQRSLLITHAHLERVFVLMSKTHQWPIQARALEIVLTLLTNDGYPPITLPLSHVELLDMLSISRWPIVASRATHAFAAMLVREHVIVFDGQFNKEVLAERTLLSLATMVDLQLQSPVKTKSATIQLSLLRSRLSAALKIAQAFRAFALSSAEDFLHIYARAATDAKDTRFVLVGRLLERLAPLCSTGPDAMLLAGKVLDFAHNQKESQEQSLRIVFALLRGSSNTTHQNVLEHAATIARTLLPSQGYSFALCALRGGVHSLAAATLFPLIEQVETEGFRLWLRCLSLFADAEQSLNESKKDESAMQIDENPAIEPLRHSIVLFERAYSVCEALSSLSPVAGGRRFQLSFLELRCAFVRQVNTTLQHAHKLAKAPFLPSPCQTLMNCAKEIGQIGDRFHFIAFSYFDIDETSLRVLAQQQHLCDVIAYVLPKFLYRHVRAFLPALASQHQFTRAPVLSTRLRATRRSSTGVLAGLLLAVDQLTIVDIIKMLHDVVALPTELPPFFLQSRTAWDIDVSTEPSWKSSSSHWVMEDQKQILKIEGVIRKNTQLKERLPWRSVGNVHVTVTPSFPPGNVPAPTYVRNRAAVDTLAERIAAAAPLEHILAQQMSDVGVGMTTHLMTQPHDDYFRVTCAVDLSPKNFTEVPASSELLLNVHVAVEEAMTGRLFHTGPDILLPIQVLHRPA